VQPNDVANRSTGPLETRALPTPRARRRSIGTNPGRLQTSQPDPAPRPEAVWHSFASRHRVMDDSRPTPGQSPPRLLDRVQQEIRVRHYSRRSEQAYVAWIRRFIVFHGTRHPKELGEPHVTAFVSSLAERGVSASTQYQALSAIHFLFEVVVGQRLGWTNDIVRAQRPVRLPVALSRDEVTAWQFPVSNRERCVSSRVVSWPPALRARLLAPSSLRLLRHALSSGGAFRQMRRSTWRTRPRAVRRVLDGSHSRYHHVKK
jgi:hypothetical protein